MKELVVISGKGGTGKTSLVASYAALAPNAVVVDCDVDAPDLHLLLSPKVERRELFVGGKRARIKSGHCTACGKCEELCRFDAVYFDGPGSGKEPRTFRIDPMACEGCGVCVWFCAEKAIAFEPVISGQWYQSVTRYGPMLHAKLYPAEANSGKLVCKLREEARKTANASGKELVLIDGSPGIGCPVIASVTGASMVLIVTEPTLAGEHDMCRVLALVRGFGLPVALCVNRADIDVQMARRIEEQAEAQGAAILPSIPYDQAFTDAQMQGKSVVEERGSIAAREVKKGWDELYRRIL